MKNATSVLNVFQLYNGNTWFFPLFLAAAAYVLARTNAENRRNALLTAGAAVLIVFNEAVYRLAGKIDNLETYYRFLWMIPVIPTLAYVCVDLMAMQKTAVRRGMAAAAALLVCVLAGDCYLETKGFQTPSQVQYISLEAVDVCNMISADKTVEQPIVACDFPLVLSIRLYDPTIKNAIVRNTYMNADTAGKAQRRLYKLVTGQKVRLKKIRRTLEKNKISYVVIKTEYDRDELMQKIGCSVVGTTSSYTVYRVD